MLSFSLLAAALPVAFATPLVERATNPVSANVVTCTHIQTSVTTNSSVAWPGSAQYAADEFHWVPSSAYNGTCTVEPGSVADVALILKSLANTTTPFAVKGGGHSGSPFFSSSTGITIALSKLNFVNYNSHTKTVDVGPGALWDDVYKGLEPFSRNVAGGRISGVGVAGFCLGGGYSWISNSYGLCMDNVLAYELVLPSGQVIEVTQTSYPDLFYGLKGGFNNFGIVTKFTMQTFPQSHTWGGLINYPASSIPAVAQALADWVIESTDLKAEIVVAFVGQNKSMSAVVLAYYNAPNPPKKNNPFAKLLAIPQTSNTLATGTFFETVQAVSPPYLNLAEQRGTIASPRVGNITIEVINAIISDIERQTANPFSPDHVVSAGIEPFIPGNILKPIGSTAWPHATLVSPLTLNSFWDSPSNDALGYASVESLMAVANTTAAAQHDTSQIYLYPNYSLSLFVTLEGLYGPNLAKNKQIAAKYDPTKVMTRSGGYMFQS